MVGLILSDGNLGVPLTAARGWPKVVCLVVIEETPTERVFAVHGAWTEGRRRI
ncbi:MAG: hypothetical protein ACK5T5_12845 [Phenylobacterium sp.]|jgi:hypothetical protein